jgi:hypothetical protein
VRIIFGLRELSVGKRPVTSDNEIIIISLTEQPNKLNKGHEEHTTKTEYHTYFTWMILS